MPEILDLMIPNKGGQDIPYRLELLLRDKGPTQLDIFHRRTEERRVKSAKEKRIRERRIRSYAFCFEYATGKLTYFSAHRGDFTNPDFSWSDTRDEQFEGDDISGEDFLKARGAAERAYDFLKEEKERVLTYKEKEKIDRFLMPLDKILNGEQ